jgi:hypothetical protein
MYKQIKLEDSIGMKAIGVLRSSQDVLIVWEDEAMSVLTTNECYGDSIIEDGEFEFLAWAPRLVAIIGWEAYKLLKKEDAKKRRREAAAAKKAQERRRRKLYESLKDEFDPEMYRQPPE